MSKKRQRTEQGVAQAIDLADALEDIQDLVPGFSVGDLQRHALEISQRLREIPDNVKHLYNILHNRYWQLDASKPDGYLLIQMFTNPGDRSALSPLMALGFKESTRQSHLYEPVPQDQATQFFVEATMADPVTVAIQLEILHDKHKNPMRLLYHRYQPQDHDGHNFINC